MSEKWIVMRTGTIMLDSGSKNKCLVNFWLSTTFLPPHMLENGISAIQFQALSLVNRSIYRQLNMLVIQINAVATLAM